MIKSQKRIKEFFIIKPYEYKHSKGVYHIWRKKTVIIGGVAGGATTAARLRRRDESMEIVVLEKGIISPLQTAVFLIISGM